MTEFEITYRGTIYPWQCDHMGHMNVIWYVGKFDEASWQILSTLGLTRARFREQGVGVAAVEQRIDYLRELYAGDSITIRSSVLELKDKAIRLIHEMRNDETGEIAARTVIVGVHFDSKARKASSWPADIRTRALMRIKEKGAAVPGVGEAITQRSRNLVDTEEGAEILSVIAALPHY